MDTIGERVAYLIDRETSSRKKFCKENDLSYDSIAPIILNKRPLGINVLNDLKRIFPNMNVNWLLYKEGNIDVKNDYENHNSNSQEPSSIYKKDTFEEIILEYLDKKSVGDKIKNIVLGSGFKQADLDVIAKLRVGIDDSDFVVRLNEFIKKDLEGKESKK